MTSEQSPLKDSTFVKAAILRHGKGDDQIYERLQLYLDATGERVDESHYGSIKWQKSCYCSFTSKKNVSHLTDDVTRDNKPITKQEEIAQIRSSRSASGTLDWTKCLFCQQLSYKKDKKLIRVSTFEYKESLEKKANEIGDAQLKVHVGDFSKLIANDALYSKGCHVSKTKTRKRTVCT